jgi:peroxiredoxin
VRQPDPESHSYLAKKKATVGNPAPDFTLPDTDGNPVSLSAHRGKIVVLDWWSAECPASERYDKWFSRRHFEWQERGAVLLAIDSNSIYDDDEIRRIRSARAIPFPILRDRGAVVADLYGAKTTPHGFVIDRDGALAYEGAIDDQSWSNAVPKVNYLEQVVTALLDGKKSPLTAVEPFGCSVKRGW